MSQEEKQILKAKADQKWEKFEAENLGRYVKIFPCESNKEYYD